MNKTEKQKFRASQELVRIEMAYSRMIVELEERYKRKRFKTTDKGNANEKPHPKGMKIKAVRTFK